MRENSKCFCKAVSFRKADTFHIILCFISCNGIRGYDDHLLIRVFHINY